MAQRRRRFSQFCSRYSLNLVLIHLPRPDLLFWSCGRLQKDHDASHPECTPLGRVTSLLLSSRDKSLPCHPWTLELAV